MNEANLTHLIKMDKILHHSGIEISAPVSILPLS